MTHTKCIVVLGAGALLAACGAEQEAPVYQMVPVSTQDIVVSASAAGTVEPVTTVEVKSKASGEIMQVRVETGDEVRTGQLLVKVDPRVPRNALDQAQADLEVARAQLANAHSQLRRAEELYKTQSITEQEFETANLQSANAKAQLVRAQRGFEDARIAFEDTEVKAPINGVIIEKNVEMGTVISSATREVGGGTVLLRMANLDTVQVRALVDETDIGKIRPGMPVTITVDAYPNQPFRGDVLKIEPQATVLQNVTMFPVLVRIPNRQSLLKPGMNAEVEVHVGSRENVLAIPNAALRTQRDISSAAAVLGLEMPEVQAQLADAARAAAAGEAGQAGRASLGGSTANGPAKPTITLPNGRTVELPEGLSEERARAIMEKMRSGGGFQALSAEERGIVQRVFRGGGPGRARGGRGDRGGATAGGLEYLFGGNYIVFALRGGEPRAVPVRTGLTDLDYSEVVSGLGESDTVLVLPSASLLASQQEWQERINRVRGGGLPGVQRQSSTSSSRGR